MASVIEKRLTTFRSMPQRGGDPSVERSGGYRQAGKINDISVITRGEALGHGFWVDEQFMNQVEAGINLRNKGSKSRFAHPSLSGDGLGKFVGRTMDAKTEGDQVKADLHISDTSLKTPDGDLGGYVMDLAESDPEAFGMSIAFDPDWDAIDDFTEANRDQSGEFTSPDPENVLNLPHVRLTSLHAVDVVDDPAANPEGLFHRGQEIAKEAEALAAYALGLTSERPSVLTLGVDVERVSQFARRFLTNHHLEVKEIEMSTDATDAQDAKVPDTADEVVNKDEALLAPEETEEATPPAPVDEAETEETETETETVAENAETVACSDKTASDYLEKWGKDGAVWFAEGLSWYEAYDAHAAKLTAENEKLRQQLSAMKVVGEEEPVNQVPTEARRRGLASKIRIAGRS